ncbi:MAG TPA: flavodoxin family protein [Methanomicrobiales archaeon]|nr:flavodoxin family protein [Methanomicrobiales archaeon]
MNILIIYHSHHRMNTEKVARAMGDAVGAQVVNVKDARNEDLAGYDLIGFGSGIYGGKPHKSLFAFIDKMSPMTKKAFIFSTSGEPKAEYHQVLRERLTEKGFQIVGEFQCPGESGFLGFTFGNKGHPDEKDLEDARAFVKGLLNN